MPALRGFRSSRSRSTELPLPAPAPVPAAPAAAALANGNRCAPTCGGPPPGVCAAKAVPQAPLRNPPVSAELLNGFRVSSEPEALRVDARNIAPFSLPQEALNFQPSEFITKFANGDEERKIYTNTPLREAELKNLKKLQDLAKAQGTCFLPSLTPMATRYLSHTRGDIQKAHDKMLLTQKWREDYFKEGPVTDEQVSDDLRLGIVYFTGRDRCLRPTLVLRPCRIPQAWYKDQKARAIDRLIRILVFCLEYMQRFLLVPGQVEGNNVILNLAGIGVSNVPMRAVHEIYAVMSNHYINRVYKFYVCNMPWVLEAVAGPCKKMLTDRQRQKIVMIKRFEELLREFSGHQLESDLGGTRPLLQEFLPFPLQPGPFDAGSKAGPNPDAVPCVHQALAGSATSHGRLWDPHLSHEENTRLEYTSVAEGIFQKCCLPIPENCPRSEVGASESKPIGVPSTVLEDPKPPREEPAEVSAMEIKGLGQGSVANCVVDEDAPDAVKPPVVIQDQDEVRPKGFGLCSCVPACIRL